MDELLAAASVLAMDVGSDGDDDTELEDAHGGAVGACGGSDAAEVEKNRNGGLPADQEDEAAKAKVLVRPMLPQIPACDPPDTFLVLP